MQRGLSLSLRPRATSSRTSAISCHKKGCEVHLTVPLEGGDLNIKSKAEPFDKALFKSESEMVRTAFKVLRRKPWGPCALFTEQGEEELRKDYGQFTVVQ
jgi:hypothetical protein